MSRREPAYDVLRLLAFVGVVLVHVGGVAFVQSGADYTLVVAEAGRFGVPIFIALSAVLSSSTVPTRARAAHIKRRAKRLLVPYVAWTGVYFLVGTMIDGQYRYGLREILFFGAGYGFHLWFLVAIFLFETLAVFVSSRWARLVLVAALALNAVLRVTGVWTNPVDALFSATSPWTDWLLLYFAALLADDWIDTAPGRIVLGVVTVLGTAFLSAGRQVLFADSKVITLAVWAVVSALCLMALFVSRGWQSDRIAGLNRAASMVLIMYILHYLPIKAMTIIWTPPSDPIAGAIYCIAVAVITLTSTALVALGWTVVLSRLKARVGTAPVERIVEDDSELEEPVSA